MNTKTTHLLSRPQIWLPLLLFMGIALGILIGHRLSSAPTASSEAYPLSDLDSHAKIEELLRYIEAKYVDSVDRAEVVEEAISSVLRTLDPHSAYIPAEELQQVNEQLEGAFEGIGIEFMLLRDTPVVISAIPGGPAQRAHMLAGDKIVSIDDTIVAGKHLSSSDIVHILRGKQGQGVKVGFQRFPSTNIRYLQLKREKIPLHSIDAAYRINERTAYIRIARFSAQTSQEFLSALDKLAPKDRSTDLIIDLRGNPGGYMQQAANILSQLFEERNKLLVYTQGYSSRRMEYKTTGRAYYSIRNLTVLIDEGSASASEIIAGAVQDQDRGLIIGRRSFGKGLVQEQYRLRNGAALRLTIARYYTPSGRSIQKPYKGVDDYEMEWIERQKNGELLSAAAIPISDSTRYFTSRGRVVYSSGGIIPDVFVPIDSQELLPYFQELEFLVPEFTLSLLQTHPGLSKEYTADSFIQHFTLADTDARHFFDFAHQRGIILQAEQIAGARNSLLQQIKAQIGRNLFGESNYYQIMNQKDPVVLIALSNMANPNPLRAVEDDKKQKQ